MFSSVVRHTKTLLSAFVITSVINVFTGIYFARILGPEIIGVYIASQLFREIVAIPFLANFNLSLYSLRKSIFSLAKKLSYIILLITPFYYLFLIISLTLFHDFIPNLNCTIVFLLSTVFIFGAYGSIGTTILQVQGKYKEASNINVSATIVSSLLAILFLYFFESIYVLVIKEIAYRIILLIGASYCINISGWFVPSFKLKPSTLKLLLYLSYQLWPVNILDYITSKLDKIMVNFYYSPIVLSSLQQARYYSELPSTLVLPLRPLFLEKLTDPEYSEHDKNKIANTASIVLIFLGVLFGLFLYFLGSELILFLLGEQWLIASMFVKNFSYYIVLLPYANFIKIIAYYKNKNKSVVIAQIVQIVMLVLSLVVVNMYYSINEIPYIFFFSIISFLGVLTVLLKK